MDDIWSAGVSAVVENLLNPRNAQVMSNSIMRPIDCCAVVWNPEYAPMSNSGLKSTPFWLVNVAAGFLVMSSVWNEDVAA